MMPSIEKFHDRCSGVILMWKSSVKVLLFGLVAGSVNATEIFGTLEFDGGAYKVLPRLSVATDSNRAFRGDETSAIKRWSFDWVDGQPAFDTKRFECRVDSKPPSCFDSKQLSLPACSQFDGLEAHFIKVSVTKSGYGDTPEERGAPSAWSKLPPEQKVGVAVFGPAMVVGGAVWLGAMSVMMSPLIVVGAVAQPECVGWKTKWVEFDHDEFGKRVDSGFNVLGMGNKNLRADSAMKYANFSKELLAYSSDVRSKITSEESNLMSRNSALRAFIRRWGDKEVLQQLSADDPQAARWQADETEKLLRADYSDALIDAKSRINNFYEADAQRRLSEGKKNHVVLAELAKKSALARVDLGMSVDSWAEFVGEVRLLEMPNDIQTAVTSAQQRALRDWRDLQARNEAERLAREQEMAVAARSREAQLRKQRAAMLREAAVFRKNLKFAMRTNCGPVIEVRPPMVKVAAPVSGYGNEHWLEIANVYPEGHGCEFVNGQYVPPKVN